MDTPSLVLLREERQQLLSVEERLNRVEIELAQVLEPLRGQATFSSAVHRHLVDGWMKLKDDTRW